MTPTSPPLSASTSSHRRTPHSTVNVTTALSTHRRHPRYVHLTSITLIVTPPINTSPPPRFPPHVYAIIITATSPPPPRPSHHLRGLAITVECVWLYKTNKDLSLGAFGSAYNNRKLCLDLGLIACKGVFGIATLSVGI
nr:hypothetical protein [Tanacetum cinerariifolium]